MPKSYSTNSQINMKNSLLTLLAVLLFSAGFAQYPVVTIQDIQNVSATALGNCDDQTIYLGDTVIVRAKVVMDGNLAVPSGASNPNGHKNFWLQQGNGGPWSGLDMFNLSSVSVSEDPHNIIAGDSVEIVGVIEDYNGESELLPLAGNSITLLGQGTTIVPTVIQLSDLNDASRNNKLETGEQWEGVYVELHNVTVATVDPFSGGSRVSFNVEDQFGNLLNVSDRFLVQKLPAEGGTFVAPNVGDQLDTLRGIIAHSKNICPGYNGRGYELYPFQEEDYVYGAAAPRIFNIARTPLVPNSTETVNITADITDNDGNVTGATIFYATGSTGGSFSPVIMNNTSGDSYAASIPAQADGTLIRWYIVAADDSGLVTTLPNNDPSVATFLYRVRNSGLSIFDVQYTPFGNGNSPYLGETVTVEGVVTSSINSSDTGDLGYVYIQQENQLTFAGLWLQQGSTLTALKRGDKVQVEGTVTESFGMTALTSIASINVVGSGTITPLVLNPDSFSVYNASQEQFEGMLVTLQNPTAGNDIYVVEPNADLASGNNYAEYRVGTDQFNPAAGSRVITGRLGGNSSLAVSYVNDSLWANTSGTMTVAPYVVKYGHFMESITGIFYYSFGAMKLMPRNNNDVVNYGGGIVYAMAAVAADTICVGDTLQFMNMSSVIADDITWDFGDATTSSDFNPLHAYGATGTFSASLVATNTVDNANATSNTLTITVIDDAAECGVGINETIGRVASIYPNPAADVITINTGFEMGTNYNINVFDIQGRKVTTLSSNKTIETLDLTVLESGTYLLQIRAENGEVLQVSQIVKK